MNQVPIIKSSTNCSCFIVYDIVGSTADRNCVILNNIHIDIMDYIVPAKCTDSEFRKMWAEFEWENKVPSLCNAIKFYLQF